MSQVDSFRTTLVFSPKDTFLEGALFKEDSIEPNGRDQRYPVASSRQRLPGL